MEAKIAKLSNGEKLRKSQPRYDARPMAGTYAPSRMGTHHKRRSYHVAKPFLPGARCGEIFVAHNARQWTFVCTFCNKSTRDIGDFICHIKARHLEVSDYFGGGSGDSYYDNSEDEYYQHEATDVSNYHARRDPRNHSRRYSRPVRAIPAHQSQSGHRMPEPTVRTSMSGSSYEEQQQSFTPHSSGEYLDYGNYLDVNVHSDDEAVDYDQKPELTVAPPVATVTQEAENENDEDVVVSRPQFNSAIGLVDVRKNADKVALKRKIAKETKQKTMERIKETMAEPVMNGDDVATSNARKRKRREEETDPDFEDFSHGANANGTFKGEDSNLDNQVLDLGSTLEPSHDGKGKRRQVRGTAYCAICNRTFQYYSLYRNHMIKHSNETPYRCELCDKGFKSKQAIRYHMNTHKRDKPHKCQLCHAGFYTESQFVTHMSTHEDGKTFPCSTCAEILTTEKERELHMASHTKERPFGCDFCQKRFRMRHHLSNHLKMHRQYRCDFCKDDFTSDVHLRKPYACDKCERTPGVIKNVDPSRLNVGRDSSDNQERSGYTFESVDVAGAVNDRRATINSNSQENASDSDGAEETEEEGDFEEIVPEDQDSDDDDVVETNDTNDPYQLLQAQDDNYAQAMGKERLTCKFCSRSYSHISGLNFHIRNKHMS